MKLLSVLCVCVLVSCSGCDRGVTTAPSYGERGSDLGIRVFQEVVRSKPLDNVVLSPHGVASILGMLLPGAAGDARRQLIHALRYKKNGPYKMLRKLHKALTTRSNQDMVQIANAIFTQKGFPIQQNFMETNKNNFQCEIRSLDFSKPRTAADEINQWVNNKTKGHIPSLVQADMLDPVLTRLLVLNAIYFKGLWKTRFQPENTKIRAFHGADGKVHMVPMMSQLGVFNMGMASTPQGLKYRVIELPYHGNAASMWLAVPYEETTPLTRIIPHVSTAAVHSWTKLLHRSRVRLLVPKFHADAEVDLEAPLAALGITDIFRPDKADFSHISAEPLHVSKALQKAKIIIDEDGTRAAAATTAILMARSSPVWIFVDRPFLFLIRHNPTGTVLFMGQINKP